MKTRYIASSLLLLCLACSDKYKSLQILDIPPFVVTSKDSMVIREKDYSNYNRGAGFIRITAKDTLATGMNLTAFDSSNHLVVIYDSLPLVQPVSLNQATVLYVAAATPGNYLLTVKITDRFKRVATRQIPVRVVKNEKPVAKMVVTPTILAPTTGEYKVDGSASESRMGRVVSYTFIIDGVKTTLFFPEIKTVLYSGTHLISLSCSDDLGAESDVCTQQIIIP